jgi:hypothetical protein
MEKITRNCSPRKWDKYKIDFLKDNYNKLSYKEIANKLNLSYNAIGHKASKLQLDSRELWTAKENKIIKDNYSCNPNIWKLLPNRTREAIKVQARKLGYQRKCGNYNINFNFFENWTKESAYVIGFFLADGCVEPHLNRISCELSMKDYNHLFNIKKLMDCENPICIKKTRNSCALYIHNKKMVNDIIIKGVIPNKSARARLPEVPEEFLRDLIRGYFDGDGSFYQDNSKKTYQFLGNINFISDLEKKLEKIGCSKKNPSIHNKGSVNCYRIRYSSKEDIKKIFNFMYYSNCFNLTRKLALASGETPGKINPAQISQVVSSSNKEPESKTEKSDSLAETKRWTPEMGDGIVHC